MKKEYSIDILLITIVFATVGCHQQQQIPEKENVDQPEDIYTCSMHPQVQEHHPGNCPICGMQLVKKNTKPIAATDIGLETLLKPTNEFVISSLPVITPERKITDMQIKAYGVIEYDTRA